MMMLLLLLLSSSSLLLFCNERVVNEFERKIKCGRSEISIAEPAPTTTATTDSVTRLSQHKCCCAGVTGGGGMVCVRRLTWDDGLRGWFGSSGGCTTAALNWKVRSNNYITCPLSRRPSLSSIFSAFLSKPKQASTLLEFCARGAASSSSTRNQPTNHTTRADNVGREATTPQASCWKFRRWTSQADPSRPRRTIVFTVAMRLNCTGRWTQVLVRP